jgi:hypothetical protein
MGAVAERGRTVGAMLREEESFFAGVPRRNGV